MAVKVKDANGKTSKIAGRGVPGKSAYEYAVGGGYTGTEEEFTRWLARPTADRVLLADGTSTVGGILDATEPKGKSVRMLSTELPSYIAAMPRLLTENLTIYVEGILENPLQIEGLYGPGSLTIRADSKGDATLRGIYSISNSLLISGYNLLLEGDANKNTHIVYGRNSNIYLADCSVDGKGSNYGVNIQIGGRFSCHNLSVKNCYIAVTARYSSVLSCIGAAEGFSGSRIGAEVYRSGIILLAGAVPNTVGGVTNSKQGGIIVNKNGVLI